MRPSRVSPGAAVYLRMSHFIPSLPTLRLILERLPDQTANRLRAGWRRELASNPVVKCRQVFGLKANTNQRAFPGSGRAPSFL
jgi:hypothetical protein